MVLEFFRCIERNNVDRLDQKNQEGFQTSNFKNKITKVLMNNNNQ